MSAASLAHVFRTSWGANPDPLREGLLGDLLTAREGTVSLPRGPGLGLEPDLKPLANLRSLHIERHA